MSIATYEQSSALLQHTLCIRPVYITQQGGVLHWYIGWYIGVGTGGRGPNILPLKYSYIGWYATRYWLLECVISLFWCEINMFFFVLC